MDRRKLLKTLIATGVGSATFHRALVVAAQDRSVISPEMIAQAEWIAGLDLSEEEREQVAGAVQRSLGDAQSLRDVPIDDTDGAALQFRPAWQKNAQGQSYRKVLRTIDTSALRRPANDAELAFMPVWQLSKLIRTRQVASEELTAIYIDRLKKYNGLLNCVVTLTEELAVRQARRADAEISAGEYRSPLHGIPWGAKDLIAYPGYPTTWGVPQFTDRRLPYKATVAQRLDDAGAVLVAKLSLGALAMGDRWFKGMTRNPWDPSQGSSGSSAGSASATAAGLVGFAIGSETHGSIVSPCRRCGATGLRPTFGRISRYGCMTLAWSLDKLGPITRSVEDCGLILAEIHGADPGDPPAVTRDFQWPPGNSIEGTRVGYIESGRSLDDRLELLHLQELGASLQPIELPEGFPIRSLMTLLDAEAAAQFDELFRKGDIDGWNAWPGIFRRAQFMPAVQYIRAQRIRRQLMVAMESAIGDVDLYVDGNDLALTNLTGHPTVVIPTAFRDAGRDRRRAISMTLTGRLGGESKLLAVARQLELFFDVNRLSPPLDKFMSDV